MGDVGDGVPEKLLCLALTVRVGVRHGHQGIDLVEQVMHGPFLIAFDGTLSPVQDIRLNFEGGVLQPFVLALQIRHTKHHHSNRRTEGSQKKKEDRILGKRPGKGRRQSGNPHISRQNLQKEGFLLLTQAHWALPPSHLYPMRRTVTIRVGFAGSSSIFDLRRRM